MAWLHTVQRLRGARGSPEADLGTELTLRPRRGHALNRIARSPLARAGSVLAVGNQSDVRTDHRARPTERHYWRDLWHYRELFQVLAWRDISVRYKQTVIGAAWALIRPFLTMVVFTVIFGNTGQPAFGRHNAIRPDGFRRHAAMDVSSQPGWPRLLTAWSAMPISSARSIFRG